jgi:hypothetical protein
MTLRGIVMSARKLILAPGDWYGWQMLPGYDETTRAPFFSPIRVERITPQKTGKSILTVAFWNVLDSEGVQDVAHDMRILKHEENYLIADLLYGEGGNTDRSAVISSIEFDWIRRMCPGIWANRPPESTSTAAQGNVSQYLNEVFGGP